MGKYGSLGRAEASAAQPLPLPLEVGGQVGELVVEAEALRSWGSGREGTEPGRVAVGSWPETAGTLGPQVGPKTWWCATARCP